MNLIDNVPEYSVSEFNDIFNEFHMVYYINFKLILILNINDYEYKHTVESSIILYYYYQKIHRSIFVNSK